MHKNTVDNCMFFNSVVLPPGLQKKMSVIWWNALTEFFLIIMPGLFV